MSANTLGLLPRRSLALARALHTTSRAAANQQPIAYHQQEVDPQLNGYPQLPWISRQRLPAKGWTDPQMRRNFGDTVRIIII
jgi:NADH dehydrogenase (ubiquinone) 1 beta subcomplex subunit 8